MTVNPSCDHQYVSTTRKRAVTAQGIFGVLMVLVGLLCLIFNPIFGVLVVIAGVLVASIGRTRTVLMCAKCGAAAPHQP
jgi:hypothetical protein